MAGQMVLEIIEDSKRQNVGFIAIRLCLNVCPDTHHPSVLKEPLGCPTNYLYNALT